jgi:hypothetical protein
VTVPVAAEGETVAVSVTLLPSATVVADAATVVVVVDVVLELLEFVELPQPVEKIVPSMTSIRANPPDSRSNRANL